MHNFAATFQRLKKSSIAVLGLPSDENSSYMAGAASGPPRIREVLHSGSSNLCTEKLVDLEAEPRFVDLGDIKLDGGAEARSIIEQTVSKLLDHGAYLLALGGDHAVTYPIIKAYAGQYPGLNILHLDAHPDLYDEFDGNRFSNACPFARIMEEKLANRLVQLGIRTMNHHQQSQAARFGVQTFTVPEWKSGFVPDFSGPVYLSLDLDVLDPAFAPGVSHPEPGGVSNRDVIGFIQRLRGRLVGADIVEFNPKRDPVGITAMAAAKLLKETAGRMLETDAA